MNNTRTCLYAAGVIACAGIPFTARAVEATDNSEASSSRPPYREWTVGAEIGSTGVGGYGSWRFSDHLGVRAGFDYFEWSEENLSIADFRYSVRAQLMSEPLTLDIYPWKAHSFHISAGVLFNQNELSGTSSGFGPVTIGGRTFEFSDVGVLSLSYKQQPVNPYLSIAGNFFYFDHAHHWALGGELGVAYTGDPKIDLTRSGGIAGSLGNNINGALAHEKDKVRDWADKLKWFPVVKLMVTYSF